MNKNKWWKISNVISISCLVAIVVIWHDTTTKRHFNTNQLTNSEQVEAYLSKKMPNSSKKRIPTGIFLQSLKFNNSTEVNITGYIWQKYDAETYKNVSDEDIPVGFILPEMVDSGNNISPTLAYRKTLPDNAQEVIGWYFESTLKQSFDYSKYPFDHKTVWIRLWSDWSGESILVPDFVAYDKTSMEDSFGYDQNIVLGHWELIETFFDYKENYYDSSFGIAQQGTNRKESELYFNVVIERKFLNSFIVYIVPLMIISCLAFATLMMITSDSALADLFGVNTSGVIGVCSGLFFVVLLSQIQIREQFAGSKIVYVEYCYPLIYGALLGISVNSYLFSQKFKGHNLFIKYIQYEDNIIPKLVFWPTLLGSTTIITAIVLLANPHGTGTATKQLASRRWDQNQTISMFSPTKLTLIGKTSTVQSNVQTLLPLSLRIQMDSTSGETLEPMKTSVVHSNYFKQKIG